jgi:hypothetical protein
MDQFGGGVDFMKYCGKAHATLIEFMVEDQMEILWPDYRLLPYHSPEWYLASDTFYAMMYFGNWLLAEAEDTGEL